MSATDPMLIDIHLNLPALRRPRSNSLTDNCLGTQSARNATATPTKPTTAADDAPTSALPAPLFRVAPPRGSDTPLSLDPLEPVSVSSGSSVVPVGVGESKVKPPAVPVEPAPEPLLPVATGPDGSVIVRALTGTPACRHEAWYSVSREVNIGQGAARRDETGKSKRRTFKRGLALFQQRLVGHEAERALEAGVEAPVRRLTA